MAACSAITAFFPSVIAKSIFAPRRADKSIEADSAPISIMNAGVAAIQVAKMGEGISAIVNDGKDKAVKTKNLSNVQGLATKSDSIFDSVKKAVKFGTKHVDVNHMIGLVALLNVLNSDEKGSALIQNGGMFGGMLLSEGAHKLICGSSSSTREDGVNKIKVKEGLYRKNKYISKKIDSFVALCEKQEEAMKDCGEVKRTLGKMMKYVPPGLKGLSFAGMSIGGSAFFYWLSGKVADATIGTETA